MHTVPRTETAVINRLRDRLTDVRYYGLSNEYAGTPSTPAEAWEIFDRHADVRLVQLDALFGAYKIIIDDQHWYGLSPAVEFVPDPPLGAAADVEAGDPADAARIFRHTVERRGRDSRKRDTYIGALAQAAIALITRSVLAAHPDAVLLELVERGDDYEEHGFLPDNRALRADGTQIALASTLVDELTTYTLELDGEAEWMWSAYIHDVRGPRPSNPYSAQSRTFVIDLRVHDQPTH